MITISHLVLLASQFGKKEIAQACIEFGSKQDTSEARDFHAWSLEGSGLIEKALSSVAHLFEHETLQKIGFEYLEITGPWNKEHHHLKSDGILLCIDVPKGWMGYFEYGGESMWTPLNHGQLIVIPKETNHGFKIQDSMTDQPLKMIGVNYPPIEDDDTILI